MTCPKCGNESFLEIQYGTPMISNELMEKIRAGEIILGGCTIEEDSPAYYCKNCKHRFGKHMELRKQRKWSPFNKSEST